MEAVFAFRHRRGKRRGFRHRRLSGREEGEEGGGCMSHSSLTILKDLLRIVGEDGGLEIRGEKLRFFLSMRERRETIMRGRIKRRHVRGA